MLLWNEAKDLFLLKNILFSSLKRKNKKNLTVNNKEKLTEMNSFSTF